LVKEGRKLRADFLRQLRVLQRTIGISEKEIRAIERARDAELLPPGDNRFWRTEVEQVPLSESEDLDDLANTGLERLLARVSQEWLRAESQKQYRLGPEFLRIPLHLVNGVRVGLNLNARVPQRFARMLLVTLDHLKKRDDLDFFAASGFVPEVAQLGNSLEQIKSIPDEMVSATVYELLVGAACIRKGLNVTMNQGRCGECRPGSSERAIDPKDQENWHSQTSRLRVWTPNAG
jgi:hypothetical protein